MLPKYEYSRCDDWWEGEGYRGLETVGDGERSADVLLFSGTGTVLGVAMKRAEGDVACDGNLVHPPRIPIPIDHREAV